MPGAPSRAHCVSALRALFNGAAKAGLIVRNPATALDKPSQATSRRRALDDTELNDLAAAVRATSLGPEPDLLLIRFHLEPGARRQGAIGLRPLTRKHYNHRFDRAQAALPWARRRPRSASPAPERSDQIARRKGARGTDWGGVMAGSTLITAPVIVFFMFVPRRVVSGLTAGAVKG